MYSIGNALAEESKSGSERRSMILLLLLAGVVATAATPPPPTAPAPPPATNPPATNPPATNPPGSTLPPPVLTNCWGVCFFMDLQRKNNKLYKQSGGTQLSSSEVSSLGSAASPSGRDGMAIVFSAFDGTAMTGEDADLNLTPVQLALCDSLINSSFPCPCNWTYIIDRCMQFVAANPQTFSGAVSACQSVGGSLSQNYPAISSNVNDLRMMRPRCPQGWSTIFNGMGPHCYQVNNSQMNWTQAELSCQAQGGHLATFSDLEGNDGYSMFKQQYCTSGLLPQIDNGHHYWIGFNDYADPGQLIYADYTFPPLSNNYNSIIDDILISTSSEYCITWSGNSSNLRKRADCSKTYRSICQIDPQPRKNWCSSIGPGWMMFAGTCYYLTNNTYQYSQGQATCGNISSMASTASMASFHTKEAWDQFLRYLMSVINLEQYSGKGHENIYIGLDCTNNPCTNLDGSTSYWWDWDNVLPKLGSCVVAQKITNNHYQWQQIIDCVTPRAIVCKLAPTLRSCPTGWTAAGNRCLKYPSPQSQVTWMDAENACHDIGGVLPDYYYEKRDLLWNVNDTLPDWWAFLEFSSSMTVLPNDTWLSWSSYADGGNDYVANTVWSVEQVFGNVSALQYFYNASTDTTFADKSKNYVLTKISNLESFINWANVNMSYKSNYICQLLQNSTCPNSILYYQRQPGKKWGLGTCYYSTNTTATFAGAEDNCEANQGRLTDVQYHKPGQAETEFEIARKVFINLQRPSSTWVGYIRGWILFDPYMNPTKRPGYISTFLGQATKDLAKSGWPDWTNGMTDNVDGNTHCLLLQTKLGNQIYLDDTCDATYGFICQAPGKFTWAAFTYNSYLSLNNGTKMDRDAAEAACSAKGGHLPAFHSMTEYDEFQRYRWARRDTGHQAEMTDVWIGLKQNASYWTWPQLDKDNYNWAYWDPLHPLSSYSCAYSDISSNDSMRWRSEDCNTPHSVICQKHLKIPQNPCKQPGFIWLYSVKRCIIPLANFTGISRKDAAAVCNASGWSLPSFDTTAQWKSFLTWTTDTSSNASMWSTNNVGGTWPITNFWLGLNYTTKRWDEQTVATYSDSAMWNLASQSGNGDCALTTVNAQKVQLQDCSSANAVDLQCQDTPLPIITTTFATTIFVTTTIGTTTELLTPPPTSSSIAPSTSSTRISSTSSTVTPSTSSSSTISVSASTGIITSSSPTTLVTTSTSSSTTKSTSVPVSSSTITTTSPPPSVSSTTVQSTVLSSSPSTSTMTSSSSSTATSTSSSSLQNTSTSSPESTSTSSPESTSTSTAMTIPTSTLPTTSTTMSTSPSTSTSAMPSTSPSTSALLTSQSSPSQSSPSQSTSQISTTTSSPTTTSTTMTSPSTSTSTSTLSSQLTSTSTSTLTSTSTSTSTTPPATTLTIIPTSASSSTSTSTSKPMSSSSLASISSSPSTSPPTSISASSSASTSTGILTTTSSSTSTSSSSSTSTSTSASSSIASSSAYTSSPSISPSLSTSSPTSAIPSTSSSSSTSSSTVISTVTSTPTSSSTKTSTNSATIPQTTAKVTRPSSSLFSSSLTSIRPSTSLTSSPSTSTSTIQSSTAPTDVFSSTSTATTRGGERTSTTASPTTTSTSSQPSTTSSEPESSTVPSSSSSISTRATSTLLETSTTEADTTRATFLDSRGSSSSIIPTKLFETSSTSSRSSLPQTTLLTISTTDFSTIIISSFVSPMQTSPYTTDSSTTSSVLSTSTTGLGTTSTKTTPIPETAASPETTAGSLTTIMVPTSETTVKTTRRQPAKTRGPILDVTEAATADFKTSSVTSFRPPTESTLLTDTTLKTTRRQPAKTRGPILDVPDAATADFGMTSASSVQSVIEFTLADTTVKTTRRQLAKTRGPILDVSAAVTADFKTTTAITVQPLIMDSTSMDTTLKTTRRQLAKTRGPILDVSAGVTADFLTSIQPFTESTSSDTTIKTTRRQLAKTRGPVLDVSAAATAFFQTTSVSSVQPFPESTLIDTTLKSTRRQLAKTRGPVLDVSAAATADFKTTSITSSTSISTTTFSVLQSSAAAITNGTSTPTSYSPIIQSTSASVSQTIPPTSLSTTPLSTSYFTSSTYASTESPSSSSEQNTPSAPPTTNTQPVTESSKADSTMKTTRRQLAKTRGPILEVSPDTGNITTTEKTTSNSLSSTSQLPNSTLATSSSTLPTLVSSSQLPQSSSSDRKTTVPNIGTSAETTSQGSTSVHQTIKITAGFKTSLGPLASLDTIAFESSTSMSTSLPLSTSTNSSVSSSSSSALLSSSTNQPISTTISQTPIRRATISSTQTSSTILSTSVLVTDQSSGTSNNSSTGIMSSSPLVSTSTTPASSSDSTSSGMSSTSSITSSASRSSVGSTDTTIGSSNTSPTSTLTDPSTGTSTSLQSSSSTRTSSDVISTTSSIDPSTTTATTTATDTTSSKTPTASDTSPALITSSSADQTTSTVKTTDKTTTSSERTESDQTDTEASDSSSAISLSTSATSQDPTSLLTTEETSQQPQTMKVSTKSRDDISPPTATPSTAAPSDSDERTRKIVEITLMTLGCAILIGLCAFAATMFILTKQYSVEAVLHINQEIALICAHILVLGLRDHTENFTVCALTSCGLQFFYTASFSFMALESLQTYSVVTNVISGGGFFNRLVNIGLGWAPAGLITGLTAAFRYSNYPATNSCWLNLRSDVLYTTASPVAVAALLTVIMTEAAGTKNFSRLPFADKNQRIAALANLNSMLALLPLCISSWLFGFVATYYSNIYLFSVVFALNVSIGVTVFVFHSLGNPEIYKILKELWQKIKC